MEQLVCSGQIQTGLKRLKDLEMAKDWSAEAGVCKFRDRFTANAVKAAKEKLGFINRLYDSLRSEQT